MFTNINWRTLLFRYGIIIAFIILCITMSLSSKYFLTPGNIINILNQSSINGILALGMTLVILTGGIDLSVGSMLAFCGIVGADFVAGKTPHSLFICFLIAIMVGVFSGAFTGGLISLFRLPPFVATLGMMSIARGASQLYNDGMPVTRLSKSFLELSSGKIYNIPLPIYIYFGLFLVFWLLMRYTRFSRYVYAVGGNEKSARTSGVNTRLVIFLVYVISGFCVAIASLILTSKTTSALTSAGIGYELDAIAAVVIGGTSLSGGTGTVTGSLFGTLFIGVINNGLDLLGVSSYWQQIIKGLVIIFAVLLDSITNKSRR